MKSSVKNYKQAPTKVRLVANALRGKKVDEARMQLKFMKCKSAGDVDKLIKSAVANSGKEEKNLLVGKFTVDEGLKLKRFRAGSRGRARPIVRRTSHIRVELEEIKE